ncbi:MAG: tRNA (adenosine(37)-N6)-dimethylallyltransferase MiaA [Comamonadaceae bacterium]|nr:tRNA (adenosine(37)-N6)-dimethylallyltransferase MiaA [Comamonadaceae bacterium]
MTTSATSAALATSGAPVPPNSPATYRLAGSNVPDLPRYLALAGPTASGKTAAALAIAQRHPVEIISVDSALVYRGMDIGSAKPSAAELAAVPHHLINIRDPLQAYSAAEFVKDASALMHDIAARGRLPLLVGGTMLYFKALRDGLDDMPPADAAIRQEIERQAAQKGWPALHAELAGVDPVTAARLAPADSQRISRAMEVYRLTGQPLSNFQTSKKVATCAINTGARSQIDQNFPNRSTTLTSPDALATSVVSASGGHLLISLEPLDRAWLHQRIAQRFEAMLTGGFLDEVKALRARGDLHPDLPAMRCVGYRQAWQYLDELAARSLNMPGASPTDELRHLAELRDKGIFATRQLAKRQITWLRSMPERCVVACDAPDAQQQVLALVEAFCQRC